MVTIPRFLVLVASSAANNSHPSYRRPRRRSTSDSWEVSNLYYYSSRIQEWISCELDSGLNYTLAACTRVAQILPVKQHHSQWLIRWSQTGLSWIEPLWSNIQSSSYPTLAGAHKSLLDSSDLALAVYAPTLRHKAAIKVQLSARISTWSGRWRATRELVDLSIRWRWLCRSGHIL